jgi:hypothetical protein
VFAAPGFLKVLGPGIVVVSAVEGPLRVDQLDSLAFSVAPGSTPEQMVLLHVSVVDASVANKWLLGATIDITPDRGPTQSCISSGPTGSCDFWVFSGTIRVHASAAGYAPADTSVSPPPAFFQSLKVSLAPAP